MMKLDSIVISSIREACEKEDVPHTEEAIRRLLERYISNELPESQVPSSLQGIYELIKGSP